MGGSQPGGEREKGKGRRSDGDGRSDSWWFRATDAAAAAAVAAVAAVKDVLPCFALFCPPPPTRREDSDPLLQVSPYSPEERALGKVFFFFFFFLFSFEADPSIYHLFLVYVACLLNEIQKILPYLPSCTTLYIHNTGQAGGEFFSAVHQNVNVKNAHMQSYFKLKLKQYIYSSSPPSPTCIYIYIQGRRRTPHPTPPHSVPLRSHFLFSFLVRCFLGAPLPRIFALNN